MDYSQAGKRFAEMRNRYAPEPGEAGAKATTCERCGGEFLQWERQYRKLCSTCAADVQFASVVQNVHKQGPIYERTVLGQYRFWAGEVRRLGLTPDE